MLKYKIPQIVTLTRLTEPVNQRNSGIKKRELPFGVTL